MANAINTLELNENKYVLTLPYAVCATAAATAAKVVTLDNFSLETGVSIVVKFTYTNSVSSPTLNVNSTGAKAIKRYGSTNASTTAGLNTWHAGAVCVFTYDGAYWVMHDQSDDTKVTQTVRTTNGNFPILLRGASAGTTTTTTTTSFGTGITANPSTKTITATTFNGTATKATADANGNNIASTYLTAEVNDFKNSLPCDGSVIYAERGCLLYQSDESYVDLYISVDNGLSWSSLYSNSNLTYAFREAPDDSVSVFFSTLRTNILLYNLILSNTPTVLVMSYQPRYHSFENEPALFTVESSSIPKAAIASMSYETYYSYCTYDGTQFNFYVCDGTNGNVLYTYAKTEATYTICSDIFYNIDWSTMNTYIGFLVEPAGDTNGQKLYKVKITYDGTFSNSVVTSGLANYNWIHEGCQLDEETFVMLTSTATGTTLSAFRAFVSAGTWKSVTLPATISDDSLAKIIPLSSWRFIVAGDDASTGNRVLYYYQTVTTEASTGDMEVSGFKLERTVFPPGNDCDISHCIYDGYCLYQNPTKQKGAIYTKEQENYSKKYNRYITLYQNNMVIFEDYTVSTDIEVTVRPSLYYSREMLQPKNITITDLTDGRIVTGTPTATINTNIKHLLRVEIDFPDGYTNSSGQTRYQQNHSLLSQIGNNTYILGLNISLTTPSGDITID